MDKPIKYGYIRHGGIKQDTAYLLMKKVEDGGLSEDDQYKYFVLLTKLALHSPRKIKIVKKEKAAKKVSVPEPPSSTNWGKKIGGE